MKTTTLRFAILAILLLSVNFSLQAQSNSSDAHLSGTIVDSSGAGVSGARVTAQPESQSSTQVWSATSTTDGAYTLVLPPGRYHLQFIRPAFKTHELVLDLAAGETRSRSFRMELEPLSSSVAVTAQAQPTLLQEAPAPISVITREEIDQRQAVSLPELLTTQPGVSMARTGREGGLATIFLDGGNSTFTKVFVDGAPINEPGGFLNFANQTLDNIDKIEIVHGAESALYGTEAVSGVIQLISHRGTTRVPEVNVFAEGGGYSSSRGGGQISGLLGAFDYSAAASYFQTDGQGPNDAFLNRGFSGNFGYSFSDSNQLRLTVRSNSSYAGVPGQTLLEPPMLSQSEALKIFATNLSWSFHTGAHWQHRLSATESRTLDTNANLPFFTSVDQYNRAGVQEQSTYSFRSGTVTGGYQYEVENGYPSAITGFHARRNNQAGYLDARWLPISRITLSAGARAEANTTFGTRVVPRVGAVFALRYGKGFWGDTHARFSYGQGFKEPSLDQSFGSDPCFPGNSTLKPERSSTIDVGIDQFLYSDKVKLTATYFANRFHDIVSFNFDFATTPLCQFGTGSYFNTDLARARGVNLAAEIRPLRWLSVKGNYSRDDTRVLAAPNAAATVELPGNHLLRRPVNSGNLFFTSAFRRFNFNLAAFFSGVRTDSDFLGRGIIRNAGYARFDLTTGYNLTHGISFYGRVINLFDKQYQDAIGYPALGRDFRVGMNYRFAGRD